MVEGTRGAGGAADSERRERRERERYRWIMVGAGGMARNWIRRYTEPHRSRVEIVALVDVNPAALRDASEFLGLPDSRCFARMEDAFEAVDADCAAVVVPPRVHRPAVELAAARGLDILSEKPMADTWEDAVAVYRAAQAAGVRLQIMQNYRYTPRIQTLKGVLESGQVVRIQEHERGRGLRIEEVPTVRLALEGHAAVVGQFLDWLDGGPAPPTVVEDNLKSTAMLFGAIQASASNQAIDVAAMVAQAQAASTAATAATGARGKAVPL